LMLIEDMVGTSGHAATQKSQTARETAVAQ